MKSLYDPIVDALYLRFVNAPIIESDEIFDGVVFDLDMDGRIVAIEFSDASKQLAEGAI